MTRPLKLPLPHLAWCISYSCQFCEQILDKTQLKGGEAYFGLEFKVIWFITLYNPSSTNCIGVAGKKRLSFKWKSDSRIQSPVTLLHLSSLSNKVSEVSPTAEPAWEQVFKAGSGSLHIQMLAQSKWRWSGWRMSAWRWWGHSVCLQLGDNFSAPGFTVTACSFVGTMLCRCSTISWRQQACLCSTWEQNKSSQLKSSVGRVAQVLPQNPNCSLLKRRHFLCHAQCPDILYERLLPLRCWGSLKQKQLVRDEAGCSWQIPLQNTNMRISMRACQLWTLVSKDTLRQLSVQKASNKVSYKCTSSICN